jgi:hypothetical protein
MSIKYDSRREALSEIIKKATVNATYVVPDLQRPYVWTPRQVTLLMDSLFRGWPFGSLLIWEVKPDCFAANEGIPHRPFWQEVDRTSEDTGSSASPLGMPATYHMVLDGQQRIQSLIIALGGDQWGFKLNDSDWALDLQDRRVRPSNHWSKASLCIDLSKFDAEVRSKAGKVRKIEAGKILEWVVLDKVAGQSPDQRPANYVYPLLKAWENEGRFIRLSRVWDLAQKDLSESEYEELLKPMFQEHGVSEATQTNLLRMFAQFMRVIENIKNNSFVHALQIESFQLTPQWTKDDYSDAIVNIFTRLNTAGRTLTREEITLAWLKIGWIPKETEGKTAGQCLANLHDALADRGFQLETDEIVRLISFVWAVERRAGNLLDSKDLLKGDIVRSLATSTARQWNRLKPNLELGADLIKLRELPDKSFNAVIVVLTWHRIVFDRFDALTGLSCIERDDLEKHLRRSAEQFVDRWSFGSEWAGVWGDAAVLNFQNFATDLNAIHKSLETCPASEFLEVVDQSIAKLMDRVVPKAIQHIENFVVKDRRRVHAYHNLLWVWHRLDAARWKCSSLPMRTGRKRTSKLEVDHTIADAWWQRRVNLETEEKLKTFTGNDLERLSVGPDGYDSRWDAQGFVNLLGNCSLLDKSFNISKSDDSMWAFLQEVHEFKQGVFVRQDWQAALLLDDIMTTPDGKTLVELKSLLQARDAAIRNELKDFINGSKPRVDIQI